MQNKKNRDIFAKSQRQLKLGEQIKRIIAEFCARQNIDITILEADVSPDGKNAKIFFGTSQKIDPKQAEKELAQIAPATRKYLSQKGYFKYTPQIVFLHDNTASKAQKIEDLIDSER